MCRDTFTSAPTDHSRARAIDAACPECQCEAHQVSEHTPKPVAPEEVLVRLVLDPDHIQYDNGKPRLKSSFFSDASSVGSSCLRKGLAHADEYKKTITAILDRAPTDRDGKPRKLYGIVQVPVAEIKKIQHKFELEDKSIETAIAFCVYATGEADRPHHSDVMVNRVATITTSKARRAEKDLAAIAGNTLITADDFRPVVDLTQWA